MNKFRQNSKSQNSLKLRETNPSRPDLLKVNCQSLKNISFYPKAKTLLNKFPLSHRSHRILAPITSSRTSQINLKQRQQQLKKYFSVVSTQQRLLTAKIISARDKNIDTIIENHDSFNERYSPNKHKFSHKLIGEVQLPRKFFNMTPQEKELEEFCHVKFSRIPEEKTLEKKKNLEVENFKKNAMSKSKERLRKVLTTIKHYKTIKIDPAVLPKIMQYLPGVPYGLSGSKEFLFACKEGDLDKVSVMIEENKWLVHVFDNSGQSALHWAIKRNHLAIAKLLLQNGGWIDNTDFVRII